MKFYVLASGSKGNSTLIVDQGIHILIDVGISKNQLFHYLEQLHINLNQINLVLLTHEHCDHLKGIDAVASLPCIYGGLNTYHGSNYHVLTPYQEFKFHHLSIIPLEVSHDAHHPLGFVFVGRYEKLVYITDTGYISERNLTLGKNADYYIIESNHNRKMLLKTSRPMMVKARIMSEFGHLSNEDASLYLGAMVGSTTKEIVLAHLSSEANTPDLAVDTCKKHLKSLGVNINNFVIKTAKQYEMIEGGRNED